MKDKKIHKLIQLEEKKQKDSINLIASENVASDDVLRALGSVLTNKYSEGYPNKRYYAGNKYIDKIELECQKRALELFKLSPKKWSVNVQPYSGSPANFAVYLGLVPIGEKIMGMSLDSGGHLTHGHPVSYTGKLWKSIQYTLNKDSQLLDYDVIKKLAKKEKPKLIVTGYTSYSRKVSFRKFKEIAKSVNAILLADISHIAGIVAAGYHMSPFKYADIVTTTTQKTLRGPRGALIFSRKEYSKIIDKTIMPGFQGGPHNNNIAAIAVCLREAKTAKFKKYIKQVLINSSLLAEELKKRGFTIISNGTDNHLFVMDCMKSRGINGNIAQNALEKKNIIVNKNTIPFDELKPMNPSGIRIGTAAITTDGFKEKDIKNLANTIDKILSSIKK